MYYTAHFDYLNLPVTKMAFHHITQILKKRFFYCCLHNDVAKNLNEKRFINTNSFSRRTILQNFRILNLLLIKWQPFQCNIKFERRASSILILIGLLSKTL